MSLAQAVASRSRRPSARVYLDGVPVRIPDSAGAISLSWSVGQPISGGTIRVVDPPFDPEIRMPVVITWGYNGHEVYGFHGFVVDPQRAAYPRAWTITVRDILWLADFPVQKEDLNLGNNLTANEALLILLRDYSGIPEERINLPPFEQSPGVPWLLGTLTPVAFGKVSPLQACLTICDPLGIYLYADEGGNVRAQVTTGAPNTGPVAYYQEERDWLISGAPSVSSNGDQVVTRVIVTGAATNLITGPSGEMRAVNVSDSWQVDNHPYLPPGKHRELSYSNPLIEYVNEAQSGAASCTAVARRLLLEHSRTPFTITIPKQKVDPRLGIAMTVAAREPRIGLPSYRKFFVMSLSRSFGGGVFEESKVLDGGVGTAGYTTIPPPTAGFVVRRMREWLDGTDTIELFLDGSPSKGYGTPEAYGPDGELVEPDGDSMQTLQAFSWTDNSTPPQTASGRRAVFRYPADAPDPEVCLTVTDVTAKTATFCQVIDLGGDLGDVPASRELSFAALATWYVTPDGGERWRIERNGQEAYAVPPISTVGSVLADSSAAAAVGLLASGGSDGGGLRQTLDDLETPSTLINPGGVRPVSFIWHHEKNPLRIWMAIGDQGFLSTDGGIVFYPIVQPFPGEPVNWIVNSFDNEQVVDFLAGPNVYTSWDSGAHLSLTFEGPPGSVARNEASGFDRHWIGFTGIEPGQSPLRSVEGDTAAFPLDLAPPVLEIRALTMLTDRPLLIAIDQAGRIWHVDATDGGSAVHMATMPESTV